VGWKKTESTNIVEKSKLTFDIEHQSINQITHYKYHRTHHIHCKYIFHRKKKSMINANKQKQENNGNELIQ